MFIIDRYLFIQFLKTFTVCFLSLAGLYMVIDGFGNLDSFLQFSEQHGNLLATMSEYYAYRTLAVFDAIGAILTLIAAMFTVSLFQRYNEMTALMAAGVSTARIVRPVVLAVAGISVITAGVREMVIPSVRHKPGLGRNAQDLLGDSGRDITPLYDQQTDILLQGKEAYADKQRIHKPNFRLLGGLDRYGNQLIGEDAFYRPPQGGRPGGYLITAVTQPAEITTKPSLLQENRPVVITPLDADWLKPDEVFVVSNVSFEQLTGGWNWRRFASVAELISGLRNPSLEFSADVRVAIHARFVQPILDITLLFLGLPLVVSGQNRNIFASTGLCFGIAAGFMVIVIGCQELGRQSFLSPALAAWMPMMIFVPIAAVVGEPLLEWNTEQQSQRAPTPAPAAG